MNKDEKIKWVKNILPKEIKDEKEYDEQLYLATWKPGPNLQKINDEIDEYVRRTFERFQKEKKEKNNE